jgi:hypothetical protein
MNKIDMSIPEGRILTKHLLSGYQSAVCTGTSTIYGGKKIVILQGLYSLQQEVVGKTKNMLKVHILLYVRSAVVT